MILSYNIKNKQKNGGFTLIEILVSITVFSIMAIGLAQAFVTVDGLYARTKQLYEVYTVLSACPEIDRALQYDQVNGAVNCFPNNTFEVEGGGTGIISYTPSLDVFSTSSLPASDELRSVPNSKVIDVQVNYPKNPSISPWKIRLLISRNGIAQL